MHACPSGCPVKVQQGERERERERESSPDDCVHFVRWSLVSVVLQLLIRFHHEEKKALYPGPSCWARNGSKERNTGVVPCAGCGGQTLINDSVGLGVWDCGT